MSHNLLKHRRNPQGTRAASTSPQGAQLLWGRQAHPSVCSLVPLRQPPGNRKHLQSSENLLWNDWTPSSERSPPCVSSRRWGGLRWSEVVWQGLADPPTHPAPCLPAARPTFSARGVGHGGVTEEDRWPPRGCAASRLPTVPDPPSTVSGTPPLAQGQVSLRVSCG